MGQGLSHKTRPGTAFDTQDGNRDALCEAQAFHLGSWSWQISLSVAWNSHHAAESGMGCRYHLPPDDKRILLSHRRYGLGRPEGVVLKAVQHARQHLLHRCLARSHARYGCPEIFNTDRGSQFTANAFTSVLCANHIVVSRNGKGHWQDNVLIEQLWKSIKYEDAYLKSYVCTSELRAGLANYFKFYNEKRWHQNFGRKTPATVYFDNLHEQAAA